MSVPSDLASRPAEEAVRRLALAQLEAALEARERLVAGDRDEALHDFRVALRRLRSLMRVYRGAFALEFPKKSLRRIAALARDTNPGRDAEVQLQWLRGVEEQLKTAERSGFRLLVLDLETRREEAYRAVEREIVRDFERLAEALGARLSCYRIAVDLERPAQPESFAQATRSVLAQGTDQLERRLAAIDGSAEEEAGHAARIAAKRLRYTAEPALPWCSAAKRPIQLLKNLQDLLGELHDGQLLAAHVARALSELEARRAEDLVAATLDVADGGAPRRAAPRRRERTGLLAVAKLLGVRRNELVAELERQWTGAAAPRLAELRTALCELDRRLSEYDPELPQETS